MTTYHVHDTKLWPRLHFRIAGGMAIEVIDFRALRMPDGCEVRIDGELCAVCETTTISHSGLPCRETRWRRIGGDVQVINAGQVLRVHAEVVGVGRAVDVS